MAPVDTTKKKKHPPSFVHLPKNRAAKLKKEWVEKKKLKSRWRAQKVREGLLSAPPRASEGGHAPLQQGGATLESHEHDSESDGSNEDDNEDGMDDRAQTKEEQSFSTDDESEFHKDPDEGAEDEIIDNAIEPQRLSKLRGYEKSGKSIPRVRKKGAPMGDSKGSSLSVRRSDKGERTPTSKAEDSSQPSLRELTRRAYSRESLHNFKAGPLHKRKAVSASSSADTQRDRSAPKGDRRELHSGGDRRGGPPRGRGRGRGGGQPNMKLRMEAMLERIKRDYT